MNDDLALRDALDDLVPRVDEVAEWDDIVARVVRLESRVDGDRPIAPGRERLQFRRRRLLAAGVVTVLCAAVLILELAAPWHGQPTVVERAAAAIAPPTSNQVLYESIRIRVTVPRLPARFQRRLHGRVPRSWVGGARLWLAGGAHGHFRLTMAGNGRFANGAAIPSQPVEIAGTTTGATGLGYSAASHALYPVPFDSPIKLSDLDPAAFVKDALAAHRAQVEGNTTIHGRKAIHILVQAPVNGKLEPVADYFVDARTYGPIRVIITRGLFGFEGPDGPTLPGMPLTSLALIQRDTLPPVVGRYVFDFAAYRHLAPTAANRKLTDIRAAHPAAKIL